MSVFSRALRSYAPGYFKGENGGTFLDAVSYAFDGMANRFEEGRAASSVGWQWTANLTGPSATARCAPEVFERHARDRGIRLYPTEPDDSKRYRLAHWRQLRQRRGTPRGELEHAQPYFLPGVLPTCWVVHTSGSGLTTWHKRDPAGVYTSRAGVVWNWDGQWSKWSRQWAIIDCTGGYPFASHVWGELGLKWGASGLVWGGTISQQAAQDLPALFRDWKSAHSRFEYIILDFEGHFGPTMGAPPAGNWDNWNNRWPNAAYLKGY